MASVNKVIILGNLGRDPETRTFPNGDRVTNITVATTEKWKDKTSNEMMEATEWHRISFNGRLAEIAEQYLNKGDPIYVEGSLRTRKYTDKDGVEKYATDIRASGMQLLGARPAQGEQQTRQQAPAPQRQSAAAQRPLAPQNTRQNPPARPGSGFDDMDDDIPFVTSSMYFDMTTSKERRMNRKCF